MKVLVDYHHSELFHSFMLTLEDRFEWDVYRPIGLDWHAEGYWKWSDDLEVLYRYLWYDEKDTIDDGNPYRLWYDESHHRYQKWVTLEQARETRFDFIISSVPGNNQGFEAFRAKYQPQAKHIAHVGNVGQTIEGFDHVLCSRLPSVKAKHVLVYRQEFDTAKTFFPTPPTPENGLICSFVAAMPHDKLRILTMRGFKQYWFGWAMPHGYLTRIDVVAEMMRRSTVGMHYKPGGDGFGHVVHNWMAVGRPVITLVNEYDGQMAAPLLEDGVTCIDLGRLGPLGVNVALSRMFSHLKHPDPAVVFDRPSSLYDYDRMCENATRRFHEVVNFDVEANNVYQFFSEV